MRRGGDGVCLRGRPGDVAKGRYGESSVVGDVGVVGVVGVVGIV